MRGLLITCLVLAACQKADHSNDQVVEARTGSGSGVAPPTRARSEQVPPPFDLKNPPADAVKTATGLVYKKITANDAGAQPKRNDVVLVNYTGWMPATGETFFTNKSRGKPMPLNLADAAPAFTEAFPLLHKGDDVVLWVPAAIGFKTKPPK